MERNILPFKDGDICFLPEQISQKEISEIKNEEYKGISVFNFLEKIKDIYKKDPRNHFFKSLPDKIQSYVATNHAIMNEDAFAIVPHLPYTSYGYIVLDNGVIANTFNLLGLNRLHRVRQLGFMMNPVMRDITLNSTALGFDHTRGLHSLDVAVILRLIILNNSNIILNTNLLSIGGASHDALTPAGSDTTKLINLELFDEDLHYKEIFKKTGWKTLRSLYRVNEEELYQMILNKGLNGQLLDIADKIGYTSRDVWEFIGLYENVDISIRSEKYLKLKNLVTQNPKFCDIWEDVKIFNSNMFIEDGYKLGIFLKVRALMYSELYYNPSSRFLEYMFSKRVINLLFNENVINKKLLLEWGDQQLEEKIWEFMGNKYFPISFEKSDYKTFVTKENRLEYIKRFKNDTSKVLIPDDFKCVTKTGVNKYFVKKNERIQIFKEAYPEISQEIEEIMTFEDRNGLYIISLNDLNIPKERHLFLKEKLE